jgi:hypothetical protein
MLRGAPGGMVQDPSLSKTPPSLGGGGRLIEGYAIYIYIYICIYIYIYIYGKV